MKFLLTSGCLLLWSLSVWAQKVVTGQIIGTDKEPIIGVAILEKGTANGTTTDIEGNFSLAVKDDSSVLVVSYIGFATQEIVVGNKNNLSITMAEDIKELDEVIVVGYGTIKKSDLTGAISSLKPNDVRQVPSGDVRDAIQGKAAGVDIVRTSGETGKTPNITIRGNRSISASNQPLYIVDGVQYSSIQDINPGDILSMEVLKDASSTAIYGARGANGVIIVTTKRGVSGDVKVSVNSYLGLSNVANWGLFQGKAYPRAYNGDEYYQLRREAFRSTNNDVYGNDEQSLGGDLNNAFQAGTQTDYTKELLHQGLQRDLQIGIAGGTDKVRTYFSLDYFDEQGLLRNDNLKRYTGRLNLDYNVNKYVKVGTQTQITNYDQFRRANPLGNASKIVPLTAGSDPSGNIIDRPGGFNLANPLIDELPNRAVDRLKTLRVFPTIYTEIAPFKGFTARANLSLNLDNRTEGIYNAVNSYTIIGRNLTTSQSSHDANYRRQINWQGILNYNKTIGKHHSIGATALNEVITNNREQFYSQAQGQILSENLYYNMGEVVTGPVTSRYTKSALVSFAGRVNYSYKGKYIFQATGRTDGASQLAEGKKWDFFPSVSGGWRISDERFMQWQKPFSTIKLRGSWGIAGNAFVQPYSTQSVLSPVQFAYDNSKDISYVFSPQVGNTSTSWEKSTTYDIGLDLGIWKERVTVGFDYYDTKTRDLLLSQRLPYSSGFSQTVANVGKTHNVGQELTISSINVQTKRFTWSSTLTFMRNREKVTEILPGLTNMVVNTTDSDGDPSGTITVVTGSPIRQSFFDYEKVGIWQQDQAEEAALYGQTPGMVHIKDQNGDGKITAEDRVVVGSTVPRWSGGFSSDFKFYNFDINLYFFARVGQRINYQYAYDPSGKENSLSTREYWTPENPTNDLPRPGLQFSQFQSSINYVDGSFFKLRNVTVGYTLPSVLTDKVKISRLRFYATAKNLFIFNKTKNYDTELEGLLTFPSVTLYVIGANLEF